MSVKGWTAMGLGLLAGVTLASTAAAQAPRGTQQPVQGTPVGQAAPGTDETARVEQQRRAQTGGEADFGRPGQVAPGAQQPAEQGAGPVMTPPAKCVDMKQILSGKGKDPRIGPKDKAKSVEGRITMRMHNGMLVSTAAGKPQMLNIEAMTVPCMNGVPLDPTVLVEGAEIRAAYVGEGNQALALQIDVVRVPPNVSGNPVLLGPDTPPGTTRPTTPPQPGAPTGATPPQPAQPPSPAQKPAGAQPPAPR